MNHFDVVGVTIHANYNLGDYQVLAAPPAHWGWEMHLAMAVAA